MLDIDFIITKLYTAKMLVKVYNPTAYFAPITKYLKKYQNTVFRTQIWSSLEVTNAAASNTH